MSGKKSYKMFLLAENRDWVHIDVDGHKIQLDLSKVISFTETVYESTKEKYVVAIQQEGAPQFVIGFPNEEQSNLFFIEFTKLVISKRNVE